MNVQVVITVDVDEAAYVKKYGIPKGAVRAHLRGYIRRSVALSELPIRDVRVSHDQHPEVAG